MDIQIGIDIVSIKRIEEFIIRFGDKGKAKFLTNNEIIIARSPQTIAGFWAAKEAAAKALRCGISKRLRFHDIEIYKSNNGAPNIRFLGDVCDIFQISSSSLSITHDNGFAVAAVIVLKNT